MSDNAYPNFSFENRNIFIVPIQQQYHKMLFPEAENIKQLSFGDIQGINTYSNTIKKAYICNSPTKHINPGDVLLFYASEYKRSITTIGIVDNVFSDFSSPEELYSMAIKRTVYSIEQIKSGFTSKSKLLLFKYYKTLDTPIPYELLKKKVFSKFLQYQLYKLVYKNYKRQI